MFDNLSAVKDAVKSCHRVTYFFSILTPPLESWPIVKMASIMEGPLSKWTNVMKGWQYRWFVLDYNAGLLSYYTSKDKMMRGSRRGCVRLRGAVIGIDDEDDSTFTITVDQKTFHFQGTYTYMGDLKNELMSTLQSVVLMPREVGCQPPYKVQRRKRSLKEER
uniref:Oxysterol binding protein-like 9 n=1 Tax=Oncorhynchus kisutch TaxID=8019 RepID=A0A8C7CTC2_ONCKI